MQIAAFDAVKQYVERVKLYFYQHAHVFIKRDQNLINRCKKSDTRFFKKKIQWCISSVSDFSRSGFRVDFFRRDNIVSYGAHCSNKETGTPHYSGLLSPYTRKCWIAVAQKAQDFVLTWILRQWMWRCTDNGLWGLKFQLCGFKGKRSCCINVASLYVIMFFAINWHQWKCRTNIGSVKPAH